jgi:hypothetical protein
MVVARSAVVTGHGEDTFRAACMQPENGWSAVTMAPAMPS